jgi:uncharacterized protein YjlB
MQSIVRRPENVIIKRFPESGHFPNNPTLPLVVFQQALTLPRDGAAAIEKLVKSNRWGNTWQWGLYDFHHYHSNAHECLCVYRGFVRVQFGGPQGTIIKARAGDVVVLPAGLAHCNVGCSADFRTLGCYPAGQSPDMQYGRPNERPAADHAIASVKLPQLDPVYGIGGPLASAWS